MKKKKGLDVSKERSQRGLTRKEFADLLGVSVNAVSSWENGTRNPSKQVILLIEGGVLD